MGTGSEDGYRKLLFLASLLFVEEAQMVREGRSTRLLLLHGAIGGVIGGVLFVVANMLIDVILGFPFYATFEGLGSLLMPGVGVGELAAVQAVPIGLILHMGFSVIYGVLFVYLATMAGRKRPGPLLFLFAIFYSGFLWVVNFLIIAPALFPDFAAFRELSLAGFTFAHAFYGVGLGAYLATKSPWTASVDEVTEP
jgi:hypothetical protein